MQLIQIMGLDEKHQVLTLNVWDRYVSNDIISLCYCYKSVQESYFFMLLKPLYSLLTLSLALLTMLSCEIVFFFSFFPLSLFADLSFFPLVKCFEVLFFSLQSILIVLLVQFVSVESSKTFLIRHLTLVMPSKLSTHLSLVCTGWQGWESCFLHSSCF